MLSAKWIIIAALYDSIMNVPGYNQGNGPGCVVDYYRDQSRGLFNLQFDVFGPVTLPRNRAYYGAHSGGKDDANADST